MKTFKCFDGFFGGHKNFTSQQYCNSTYFARDSWFPFTCIVSENNAFLGYFFYPVDFLKSVGGYNGDYSYRLMYLYGVYYYYIISFLYFSIGWAGVL